MEKFVRLFIVTGLMLVTAFAASNHVAWADPATAVRPSGLEAGQSSVSADKPDPGTVQPPPAELTLCEEGVKSVGGVATLEVSNLAPGYCIVAFLRTHAFAVGRIPDGAGDVLAPITFLRVFYQGELIYELPTEDGQVEICYAVPPGKTAQIYYLNFYGPRFGERTGQPSWELLDTTVDGGQACAPAQTTGAYALIGY